VSDSLSLLLYSLHVRLLRASIKINQSMFSNITFSFMLKVYTTASIFSRRIHSIDQVFCL